MSDRLTSLRHGDGAKANALPRRWRNYLPGLTNFLEKTRPDALLTAKTLGNLVGLLAVKRARTGTRIVVSDRVHLSTSIDRSRRSWKGERLPRLVRELYPNADGVVAISDAVAEDLATVGDLPEGRVITIHNGLLRAGALDLPAADHPWFDGEAPVILGVGRLAQQKDFATLIRAFALLRKQRTAKLMILGEGRERPDLEALLDSLGLKADVLMPGFVDNPFAYLKAASLFVMSSTHEGFGNALLEALASGCPAMSTDCPAGPREILADGKIGPLVPVGDAEAMAAAMMRMLDDPPEPSLLLNRAADFSMDRVAERYLACLLPDYSGLAAAS